MVGAGVFSNIDVALMAHPDAYDDREPIMLAREGYVVYRANICLKVITLRKERLEINLSASTKEAFTLIILQTR